MKKEGWLLTRVVITGMSSITHLGIGHDVLLNGLLNQGTSSPSTWLSEENKINLKGYLISDQDEEFINLLSKFKTRNMDRFAKLSVAAVSCGIKDANLKPSGIEKAGFIMNTTFGPWKSTNQYTKELIKSGPNLASPRMFPNTVVNSAQGHICISFGIKGPTSTLAGISSIPYAESLIQKGVTDRVIVVGADEANENIMEAYNQMGSRLIFGEGVGVIVLESAKSAIERDAKIYGEISNYEIGCEPSLNLWFEDGNHESDVYKELLDNILFNNQSDNLIVMSSANQTNSVAAIEENALHKLRETYPGLEIYYPKEVYGETFGASSILSVINASKLLHMNTHPNEAVVLSNEIGGNHMALKLKRW